ncbi:MAG: nucleoside deaminase [Bdellovibrionota bacterium]
MNQDMEFMKRAIELSKNNVTSLNGGPFGAVVVRNGQIIGEGANLVTCNNDPTAHAEVLAIRAACNKIANFDLSGATIYTSCEPCPMCLAAIYWARIDKIYYANTRADAARIKFDDDLIYNEIPKDPSLRKIPSQELLRTEAQIVFTMWDQSTEKVRY